MRYWTTENVDVDVQVDIKVEDFLDECALPDIREVIQYLKDEYPDLLRESLGVLNINGAHQQEYLRKLVELANHAYAFTPEEESALNAMFKKYL